MNISVMHKARGNVGVGGIVISVSLRIVRIVTYAANLLVPVFFVVLSSASYAYEVAPLEPASNATLGFQLQTQAEPVASTPSIGSELLENLHVTGFLQNTVGVFYNSKATKWQPHKHFNSLENERTLLQTDVNESFGEHFQFFARFWGVYEPAYPFENDARVGDRNLSDFYNDYAFRDLWAKFKFGPLTTFVGKQIVEWGESLAFRIGDQVNPQDVSYGFGFANLEQSHMPIWMLHPILNLPAEGPFSSNFFESIYAPGFDFMYTHVDYPDDRFNGQDNVAGRVDVLPSAGSRFAGGSDNRCRPGESFCIAPGAAVEPPISYVLKGGQIPNAQWEIPRATFANSQIGLRFHTLIGSTVEATAFYWRSFDYTPTVQLGAPGARGTTRRVNLIFPHYESAGATLNTPVPLPIELANILPLVIRAEAFYKNHEAFDTSARSVTSGVVNSDTLNTLLALDLDSYYAPWLTKTGTVNANFEFQELTILDASDHMLEAGGVLTKAHKHEVNLLASIAPSWYFGAIAPSYTTIYNPDGTTFILIPGVTLTPPWTNKYFVKFSSQIILGNDKYAFAAGGSIKGLSNIIAQFQYNFSAF